MLETYELEYMVSLPMMHGDGSGPSSTCISFEQQNSVMGSLVVVSKLNTKEAVAHDVHKVLKDAVE